MNKIVLTKAGNLNINGTDVFAVKGFVIKGTEEDGTATICVEFDATEFEIEVGVNDFSAGATAAKGPG